MSKITCIQQEIVVSNYNGLLKCTYPKNLTNTKLISKEISKIERTKPFLPSNVYDSFMNVINENIRPIIDDNDTFLSSLHTPDIGFFNDDGNFEFKGEYELKLFFAKLCQLSLDLERRVEEWACSVLSPLF